MILGQYLGVSPGHVEIGGATNGKPRLATPPPTCSRSASIFPIPRIWRWSAWHRPADQHEDVEHWRPLVNAERAWSSSFFAEGERSLLAGAAGARAVSPPFFAVGRARKPISKPGAWASPWGSTSSKSHSLPANQIQSGRGGRHGGNSTTCWQIDDISAGEAYSAAYAVEGEIEKASLLMILAVPKDSRSLPHCRNGG